MQRPHFGAQTRGSPGMAELGLDPQTPGSSPGPYRLGLPGEAKVHPEEVGGNPPECGILSILGKSRVVRRSDSLAGINNNTHPLYKVRSLLAIYPGPLLLPVNLTHRSTNLAVGAPSGTTLGPPHREITFTCFAGLGSALPSTPRARQFSSVRGSSALLQLAPSVGIVR